MAWIIDMKRWLHRSPVGENYLKLTSAKVARDTLLQAISYAATCHCHIDTQRGFIDTELARNFHRLPLAVFSNSHR